MQTPKRNAKTADWVAYARSKGVAEAELQGLTREQVQDLLGESGPKQDADVPAQAEAQQGPVVSDLEGEDESDTTPSPTAQVEAPDYSRFLNTQTDIPDPALAPETGAANPTETVEVDTKVEVQVPTGEPAITGKGGTVLALVIDGTYQVTDETGFRHQAEKGTLIKITEEKAKRAEKLKVIRRV